MKLLKKIWNDPVGSKVIAALIIFIFSVIWTVYSASHNNIDIWTAFLNFWTYSISLWIIALVSILLISLNLIISRQFKYTEETLILDKQVYEDIKVNLLPQNGSISFLRSNNFAGFSFNINNLNDVVNFENALSNSTFYFLNPRLEKIKTELAVKISHFNTLIAFNTFVTPNGFQTVPPEWETNQPERFWEVVNDLHSTTNDLCRIYDELIKTGRTILKI